MDSISLKKTQSITLSWQVGKSKPSREIFEAACRNLGVPPNECLMVGDDLDEDYTAGRAAGLHSVLLSRERHEADWVRREMESEEMDGVHTISNLRLLPDWIAAKHGTSTTSSA